MVLHGYNYGIVVNQSLINESLNGGKNLFMGLSMVLISMRWVITPTTMVEATY